MGLSLDNPFQIIYVQGELLIRIVFQVTFTRFELKEAFSSLCICICPESLMEQVQTKHVACHVPTLLYGDSKRA